MLDPEQVQDFAERYTAAWCSHDAARVAAFYSPEGSLTINDDSPAVGWVEIVAAAQGFMSAFPDLTVLMDGIEFHGPRVIYHWTLIGTNSGRGGAGKRVHISGFEEWRIGADGLIAESRGHFDREEYKRQLERGANEK